MYPFRYTRATDLESALSSLADDQARPIAGGTNLLDLMKEHVMRPEQLVDITRLPLQTIQKTADGGLSLGALVKNAETAAHPEVQQQYPLLSKAILAGASPQLRNMASNGGNLMQRTRCYYFYDIATACNKRQPGSGCAAQTGYNRIHAILGASEQCIAVHPSDMCVALAALEAVVHVRGPKGERRIPFADFHRLPGDQPELDNHLAPDELILAIELPPEDYSQHFEYLKVRDRHSYAFALVSAAVALQIDQGLIQSARIAMGGLAHKPWRDLKAENLLKGQAPVRACFEQAAEQLLAGAQTYAHNDFKPELAKRGLIRALERATAASERKSA